MALTFANVLPAIIRLHSPLSPARLLAKGWPNLMQMEFVNVTRLLFTRTTLVFVLLSHRLINLMDLASAIRFTIKSKSHPYCAAHPVPSSLRQTLMEFADVFKVQDTIKLALLP